MEVLPSSFVVKLGKKLTSAGFQLNVLLPDFFVFYRRNVQTELLPIPKDVWRRLLPRSNILKEILSFALEPKD